jgi:hypothetical protein
VAGNITQALLLGPADWLPVGLAAVLAVVGGAARTEWSVITRAFEVIPDTYKPFSRIGRDFIESKRSTDNQPTTRARTCV